MLERLAERLGVSMAETLRVALRRLAAADRGEDDPLLRLAGSLDDPDVPADLSTRHDDYAVSGYAAARVAEPDPGDQEPERLTTGSGPATAWPGSWSSAIRGSPPATFCTWPRAFGTMSPRSEASIGP